MGYVRISFSSFLCFYFLENHLSYLYLFVLTILRQYYICTNLCFKHLHCIHPDETGIIDKLNELT